MLFSFNASTWPAVKHLSNFNARITQKSTKQIKNFRSVLFFDFVLLFVPVCLCACVPVCVCVWGMLSVMRIYWPAFAKWINSHFNLSLPERIWLNKCKNCSVSIAKDDHNIAWLRLFSILHGVEWMYVSHCLLLMPMLWNIIIRFENMNIGRKKGTKRTKPQSTEQFKTLKRNETKQKRKENICCYSWWFVYLRIPFISIVTVSQAGRQAAKAQASIWHTIHFQ